MFTVHTVQGILISVFYHSLLWGLDGAILAHSFFLGNWCLKQPRKIKGPCKQKHTHSMQIAWFIEYSFKIQQKHCKELPHHPGEAAGPAEESQLAAGQGAGPALLTNPSKPQAEWLDDPGSCGQQSMWLGLLSLSQVSGEFSGLGLHHLFSKQVVYCSVLGRSRWSHLCQGALFMLMSIGLWLLSFYTISVLRVNQLISSLGWTWE